MILASILVDKFSDSSKSAFVRLHRLLLPSYAESRPTSLVEQDAEFCKL